MIDTPWSENNELFIKELKEGHEWQSYPALFFKLHGLKVEIPKLTIRETISEADKWKDSFDIIVEDIPLENKSRNEEFTFSGDFPYPTIIVDTVKGFDAKKIKPHGYTMISKPTGIILWLPVSTFSKWTKEKKHDNIRNLDDEFYVCDPKYLQHMDTLLRFLKRVKKMIKVEMLVGIPGSGKSTYAKQVVAKDPSNWVRVNNDDLRAMMNGSVWSADYEKMVTDARNYLIRDALKRGKNVIIDNLNINRRHFDDVSKIAKSVNADIQVFEKAFYIELDEALERNAKREGAARVPDDVVKKWFKDSGGKQFKYFKPRVEIYKEHRGNLQSTVEAPLWDDKLPAAVLCDLDGTLALIHNRSPYDASNCDIKDLPNVPVIETVMAHHRSGRYIIFCSGREDKYRPETERFIQMHCKGLPYELYMRKTDDFRKDAIIKEEIYQNQIEGKYNVLCVLDDRDQVVEFWRAKGLTCFQVAPGNF